MNRTPETTETEVHSDQPDSAARSWRRLPRGRRAMAAGAAVAALALGGTGFVAGYAVGAQADTTTQQTTVDQGDRGFPGSGPGGTMGGQMDGPLDGQMGGPPDGTQDGTTGQAPDFDGDGQPDETVPDPGTGTDSSSGSDTGTQQS